MLNYPLIFQAVYCEPLAIEVSHFHGINAFLWPRISGQVSAADIGEVIAASDKPLKFGHARASRPGLSLRADGSIETQYFYTVEGRSDIAVIPVQGMLAKGAGFLQEACMGMVNPDRVSHALAQAVADKQIKTIVLDIASPGGTVVGTAEIGAQVRAAAQTKGKTVYAFTDHIMASAAYWIASQANEVIGTPSARVGSIGTIMGMLDETVRMQMQGVKMEVFSSGKHKALGMPGRQLTQDDRAYLQSIVDKANAGFVGVVKAARPQATEEALTHAKVYNSPDALAEGLIDGMANSFDELLSLL